MGIRVIHGCFDQYIDAAGNTVAKIKRALRDVGNIPLDAVGLRDGIPVHDDNVLTEGAAVEFVKPQGVKGLGRLLTREQLIQEWNLEQHQYGELLAQGLPTVSFSDGVVVHPESAVDEFFRVQWAEPQERLAYAVEQIADVLAPSPSDVVGTPYVAQRLGCSKVWITELVRRGDIPKHCVVEGTGDGKPWKFHKKQIDRWLRNR